MEISNPLFQLIIICHINVLISSMIIYVVTRILVLLSAKAILLAGFGVSEWSLASSCMVHFYTTWLVRSHFSLHCPIVKHGDGVTTRFALTWGCSLWRESLLLSTQHGHQTLSLLHCLIFKDVFVLISVPSSKQALISNTIASDQYWSWKGTHSAQCSF